MSRCARRGGGVFVYGGVAEGCVVGEIGVLQLLGAQNRGGLRWVMAAFRVAWIAVAEITILMSPIYSALQKSATCAQNGPRHFA